MILILFLIISISIVLFEKRREGRWINLLSLLIAPYIIIVFINNFFIYKLGFFKIDDNVLLMLTGVFCVVFLASLPFRFNKYSFSDKKNKEILSRYDIRSIKRFLYIVGIIGILKIIVLYRSGVLFSTNEESEGIMGNGIVGHLLLSTYSVLPIYFLNWTYKKKWIDFIPILLILIVAFSSFIKYNVIGPLIAIFIFVCFYRKTLLKKSILIFSIFVLFFFVFNYALSFAIAGSDVDSSFYLGHFWKYFAGSVINDNYVFDSDLNPDTTIYDKLIYFLMAFPNMFIGKIFNTTFGKGLYIPMQEVSNFGEESNVFDVFGYLFPSKGDFGAILIYYIIVFLISIIICYIYYNAIKKRNSYCTFLSLFLTYFVFLDFFSPFFVKSGPWEIIIWSLILPKFFKYDNRIIKRIKNKLQWLLSKYLFNSTIIKQS